MSFYALVAVDALNAEAPVACLTDYLTPNELFFVRHHVEPARTDPRAWRLAVDGEVARPLSLTFDELGRFPRVEPTCVLQCAGNARTLFDLPTPGLPWGRGAVGNARWGGVAVRDLLEEAGLRPTARHLHSAGTDEPPPDEPAFLRSLPIEKALEDAIVALEMNGEPLPHLHGGPARLVVPGWAGQHWMKWLRTLSARESPARGYYMDVEYRFPPVPGRPGDDVPADEMEPITEIPLRATITRAPERAHVGEPVMLRGFAVSGAPDVACVEISDDDGLTWSPAAIDPRHDPWAWRLWSFDWTPARSGRLRVHVRATDSRGRVQPRDATWNPGGYLHDGWESVEIEVAG